MLSRELLKTVLKNNSGLQAYYRFESGALTTDSSGNGKTLSQGGTVNVGTGKWGGSASANWNTSNNLAVNLTGSAIGLANFSIVASIKMASAPTNDYSPTIISHGSGNRAALHIGKNNGCPQFMIYNGSGMYITSPTSVCDGNWHRIVGVRNGSTGYLWVDGVLIGSATGANKNVDGAVTYFGNHGDPTYDNLGNAELDDVAFFNIALTPDQVKDIEEGRVLGELYPQANLQNLYHLNHNFLDYSNNNRHLGLTGTVSLGVGKLDKSANATWNGGNNLVGSTFSLGTGNITMGCLFKAAAPSETLYEPYVLCIDNNSSNTPRIGIVVQKSTGKPVFNSWNSTPEGSSVTGTSNVCDGKWHLLVGIRNGTTMQIYVDGNLEYSATVTTRDVPSNTIRFGKDADNTYDLLNMAAYLDEVFVYSEAKSAAWVRRLAALIFSKQQ